MADSTRKEDFPGPVLSVEVVELSSRPIFLSADVGLLQHLQVLGENRTVR